MATLGNFARRQVPGGSPEDSSVAARAAASFAMTAIWPSEVSQALPAYSAYTLDAFRYLCQSLCALG